MHDELPIVAVHYVHRTHARARQPRGQRSVSGAWRVRSLNFARQGDDAPWPHADSTMLTGNSSVEPMQGSRHEADVASTAFVQLVACARAV